MSFLKRRPVRIGLAFLAIWLSVAAILMGWGAAQALDGREHLNIAQADVSADALASGELEDELKEAYGDLKGSHSKFSSPPVAALRIIPLAGTQVTSATRITGAAANASGVATDTLTRVRELDAAEVDDRSQSLAEIARISNDGAARLANIDLGPRSWLLGPLADARAQGDEQVRSMTNALVRGGAAAEGLSTLLGPEEADYLLLAANNGEMRNGTGMFLQVGLLRTGNNQLSLSDTQSVSVADAPEAAISWPPDMQENWDWLGNRGSMRDLMLSPRFDVSAPIAKEIWEHGGRPRVAGVISVDIPMLRALLAVTGPVEVEGVSYNKDNAEQALLFQQYAGADISAINAERSEGLSDVASAVFDEFATGDWSAAAGARELGRAADGRHILIWSADTELNEKWVTAGVNGTVLANDTLLSAINLGTNKLDQFLDMAVDLEVGRPETGVESIMRITVSNNAPDAGPLYVLGDEAGTTIPTGSYNGLLAATLPPDATNIRFDGNLPLSVAGRDGISQIVATGLNVPRGNTQEFVLRFARPSTTQGTTIRPSARVPAVEWTYGDQQWNDETPRRVQY